MKKAFTLIELLVVIAIIAILAAILFPVFAQAKLAAKKAVSISNVKQIDLAVIMYANDVDDIYPYAQPGNYQFTQSWMVNAQPYMKTFQILVSPADTLPRANYGPGTSSGPPFSYPGNGTVCYDSSGWSVHGVLNARQTWWSNYDTAISTTSVGLPAETILTGERHKIRPYADRDLYGAWDLNDVIFYGWVGDLPGQAVNKVFVAPIPTSNGSVTAPYANNATFSFVDGHAAAMNPSKTVNMSANSNGNCNTDNNGFFKMWDAQRTK